MTGHARGGATRGLLPASMWGGKRIRRRGGIGRGLLWRRSGSRRPGDVLGRGYGPRGRSHSRCHRWRKEGISSRSSRDGPCDSPERCDLDPIDHLCRTAPRLGVLRNTGSVRETVVLESSERTCPPIRAIRTTGSFIPPGYSSQLHLTTQQMADGSHR